MFPLTAHTAYSRRRVSRVAAVAFAAAALTLAVSRPAVAQEDSQAALKKITDLNKQAVQDYQAGKPDDARKLLKQALELCASASLDKHPIKARTHIHLGIVALMGLNQRDLGIIQFKKALEIQSDIKLTKSLVTPEVEKAFEEARTQFAGGGDSGGAATPAPEPETPAGSGDAGAGGGDKPQTPPPPAADESSPLKHAPITSAAKGEAIEIMVQPDASLTFKRVVLAYRPEGATDYLGREMHKNGDVYTAEIPTTATKGNLVSYYVEAQNEESQAVANRGSVAEPYLVKLTGSVAEPEEECTGADCEEEEKPARFFISLTAGTGFGMATGKGDMDVETNIQNSFGQAKAFHVAPELGFFLNENWVLSLQLRLQSVSGTNGHVPEAGNTSCGADGLCKPGNSALAVFGRLTYFFGEGRVKPFLGLLAGGGYIRHVGAFSQKTDCGPNVDQKCVDSFSGGPVLVGGAAGLALHLTNKLAFVLRLDVQAGFPKATVNFDGSAGFALRL